MRLNLFKLIVVFMASFACYGEESKLEFEKSRKDLFKKLDKPFLNVLDRVTIPLRKPLGNVSFEVVCDLEILNFRRDSHILISVGSMNCEVVCRNSGRDYRVAGLKLEKRDQYKKLRLVFRYCSFTRSTCILVKDGDKVVRKVPWQKKYLKQSFRNLSVSTRMNRTREGGKKKRGAAMKRVIPENKSGIFTELKGKTIVCNRGFKVVKKKKGKGAKKKGGKQETASKDAPAAPPKRFVDFKVTPGSINIVEYGFEDSLKR